MGARSAGNPHAACDVEGTGNVARSKGLPARQSSTLPPDAGGRTTEKRGDSGGIAESPVLSSYQRCHFLRM
jgi:hypothetical protein